MNHFTDKQGYNSIRSQPTWLFVAGQPPGEHPPGAYFTTLPPTERRLAHKLRIPVSKLQYRFAFQGDNGLLPLPGGRGGYIFYSPVDYPVDRERQSEHGETGL
jgi:hypothetical protein